MKLTYDAVRLMNEEFKKLIKEKKNQGTREEGKDDAMAIVKNYVSEGDYRAISRTIVYYGDGYGFGVHAVVRSMLRLISFYDATGKYKNETNENSESEN